MTALEDQHAEDEAIFAYRLGRLEKTLENSFKELLEKIDKFQTVRDNQIILTEKVGSLEKSRERFIAALAVISTSLVVLVIMRFIEWSNKA